MAITEAPAASVIIPHHNDTRRLRTCLAALVPQLATAPQPVEVIVADNNSSEDLGAIRAEFPQVRFLLETTPGAAAARNAGVAASAAPRLFFLDADCVPAPDWLAVALALPAGDMMIGGRVTVFDETPGPRSGAEAFETVFAFPQEVYVRQGFSVTANLLTTRAVFDATGPFDPLKSEDQDFCHRAGRKGFPIQYRPDLVVAHPTRSDWAALQRKWRRITDQSFMVNGTGPGRRARWVLRGVAVAGSGLIHMGRVLRHPALNGAERRRGAATLLKLRLCRAGWMWRAAAFPRR
ncbi:glycosyltransferase family 2 protein [Falsirhodobacter sp. 20TX0035]|uniref:glycosyltransferase family 2 protein n=1 Tax=Falsirhodobacter sp. 20TX0035 TaxID=3022019 RepID=UPI00232E8422|nr:glycosyltransferase [Falsirhodobacter sp. 20TX0035]MDB6452957.1 glycosyltransferase [Falsirhodobacter sp. 20TX0035]